MMIVFPSSPVSFSAAMILPTARSAHVISRYKVRVRSWYAGGHENSENHPHLPAFPLVAQLETRPFVAWRWVSLYALRARHQHTNDRRGVVWAEKKIRSWNKFPPFHPCGFAVNSCKWGLGAAPRNQQQVLESQPPRHTKGSLWTRNPPPRRLTSRPHFFRLACSCHLFW